MIRFTDSPVSSVIVALSCSPLIVSKGLISNLDMSVNTLSHAVPLHQVSEQVHDLLLQGGPVLDDGVSFVGHLLLKLLQLFDLLTNLELRLSQGCDPS